MQTAEKLKVRADRKAAKRRDKQDQIAQSAVKALRDLGYANTTLRDIAAHSDLSLGMLHYYFEDKVQLIIYCVQSYKEEFVRDLYERTRNSTDAHSFYNGLAQSLLADWRTHRLWYDMRVQAMFDDSFKPIVSQIEADMVALVQSVMGAKTSFEDAYFAYTLIDGVFANFIQALTLGKPVTHDDIVASFARIELGVK